MGGQTGEVWVSGWADRWGVGVYIRMWLGSVHMTETLMHACTGGLCLYSLHTH